MRCEMNNRTIAEYAKLAAVVLFAMLEGAASYHQYIVNRPRQVETYRIEQAKILPDQLEEKIDFDIEHLDVVELSEEDIQEEEYTDDLELLAACVEAEAGNQGLDGKRMVADVILNRVEDPDWPNTIEGVITQKYQFSTYWNGAMESVSISDETFEACKMELKERGWPGIYYFTAGGYGEYGTPWRKVGDHYFCTK